MGLIGYAAIIASFLMIALGYDPRARVPFTVLLAVPVFQLIGLYTSLAFITARPADTDTITYFYDLFGALGDSLKPGTSFIVYLTTFMTSLLDASFEDMMAIYSLSGAAASFLLLRYPALAGYEGRYPILPAIAVLLPTFHFYTTAIGKDGLSALAIVLIMIGSSNLSVRWRSFCGGFLLLVLVRPHIAAASALAFLISQMIGSGSRWARIAVVPALIVGSVVAYYVFQSFLGINIFNLNDVSAFLGERSDALATSNYTISASDNIVLRLVGFMYFPLFFNAESTLALAASMENLILIAITVRIVTTMSGRDIRSDANVRFLLILIVALWVFMGATTYNIGLGLRTKTSMVTPVFLALFALTETLRRMRKAQGKQPSASPDRSTASVLPQFH